MANDPASLQSEVVIDPSAPKGDLSTPHGDALPARPHLQKPTPPSHPVADCVRYLYFMRFSLLLWASMLVLALADFSPSIATITRGILTPFSPVQWFFTGFTVVLPGWFALLAARIVCAYGKDRFSTPPPLIFTVNDKMEWYVFWPAQLPGAFLLWRIAYNAVHEGEGSRTEVWSLLLAGAFAAIVFWYLVAILYYWTYDPDNSIPAHAFLVPAWKPLNLEKIEALRPTSSLRFFHRQTERLCGLGPGYISEVKVLRDRPRLERVSPGHVVATIAFLLAVILYFMLMAISAPMPVPRLAWVGRGLAALFAYYVIRHFLIFSIQELFAKTASSARSRTPSERWLPTVAAAVMTVLFLVAGLQRSAPRALPVIAYVVILLMVIFWTLAGVAFFADRFRLPVLSAAVVFILALNKFPIEHVFSVRPVPPERTTERLPDPADFVKRLAFQGDSGTEPVIIITATGGGIHAAAWTATVLRALDQEFGTLKFHNHILLMSTVSGGSVATAGFLREYLARQPFTPAAYDRVQAAAGCSSLQAVAWGLAYPDTLHLFFAPIFHFLPWLDRFDRGWALERALQRNLHDPACLGPNSPDPTTQDPTLKDPAQISLDDLAHLASLPPDKLDPENASSHFPAFTLNTTVVETGDRFLLSNYSVFSGGSTPRAATKNDNPGDPGVKADSRPTFDDFPAASFLGVYGRETILPLPHPKKVPGRGGFADISLLTAARLSASFTYVSPASRLPFAMAQGKMKNAYHFVDGGYYDNDGTNSAIEFLKAASPVLSRNRPLRVLLIEIRNTDDINVSDSPDSYAYQAGLKWNGTDWDPKEASVRKRFGPLDQLAAPPEAAIAAGFSSVTRRNRRELGILQEAMCDKLDLHRVTIDYQQHILNKPDTTETDDGESETDQPLSWHLTQRQRNWIETGPDEALDRTKKLSGGNLSSDRLQIREAVDWFQRAMEQANSRLPVSPGCRKYDPPTAEK